ncbi:hypothetical protein G7046_g5907 [Stylonectria norvegica]|nr:hypothetical protein G7046_g5907 [Stylonectria norvegica]
MTIIPPFSPHTNPPRSAVLLTTWHLIFATLATQLLARTTSLLDSRHALPLTGRLYTRTILPIGLLYSGSLVCSNLVYLYLSVAFIQILKSAAPVAVLLTSWLWGVADPSAGTLVNILVIVFGVGLASVGEIEFSWLGFLFQLGGTVFEAVRLVMIQVMLSAEGLRMDPLVGLYYYAPVCAVMNLLVAAVSEMPYFAWEDFQRTGFWMLFLNALVAFLLNVASVFLIGKTSGLVMTLTGMLKNILLVVISIIIWHTTVTGLQSLGYGIALAGLAYYSIGYEQSCRGYRDAKVWASKTWASPPPWENKLTAGARRILLLVAIAFVSVVVFVLVLYAKGVSGQDALQLTTTWLGSE